MEQTGVTVSIDLADETFLAVAPEVVSHAVSQSHRWRHWWPDLRLTVHHDRGPEGLRWTVSGALAGSAEFWLEPVLDGTVVHYFLRGEVEGPASAAVAETRRRRVAGRAALFALKRELENGRPAGEPVDTARGVEGPAGTAPDGSARR